MQELQRYYDQFAAIERDATVLIEGLTERQLTWREDVRTWSIADCLNHLVVTGNQSLGWAFEGRSFTRAPAACLAEMEVGTALLQRGSFV